MSFLCHFTLCVPIKSFAIFRLAEKWEKGHKTKALEVVGFFKIYGKSPLSSNKLIKFLSQRKKLLKNMIISLLCLS